MYDILKGPDVFQRALPSPPTRRWAAETLRYNLDKVIAYRRGLPRKVDGSHLLLRLIESLNINLLLPDQDYVWGVTDASLRVANSLRMTSMWGHGFPFQPAICYGPEGKEVIIANTDDFKIREARENWEELVPIRVMAHPCNDFTLPWLDGSGEGLTGGGWSVIAINIPMLAFQHKCWWETYVKSNSDSPPGSNLFFNRYPLANLLRSHLDITLLNRTMAMDLEQPILPQKDPNPFYVGFQQAGQTDRTIDHALTFMQRSNLSFDDWLDCVPQVSVDNVHDWLALPDITFTTQVEWAIFMARLPVMGWLLAHNAKVDSAYNAQYVNNIRHWLRRMKNGRFYHQGLRGALLDEVLSIVNQTIEPYV